MARELINGFESFTGGNTLINKDCAKIVGNGWITDGQSYIPIDPNGGLFYYDIVYSNRTAGNQYYIGFERYNASKGTGSNSSCVYVISTTTVCESKRVNGTVNLTGTINDSPISYLRLRILNQWTGSSATDAILEIKQLSLFQLDTPMATNIEKNAIVKSGHFRENHFNEAKIFKNEGFEANQFIEI